MIPLLCMANQIGILPKRVNFYQVSLPSYFLDSSILHNIESFLVCCLKIKSSSQYEMHI